jgi:lipoprotein-anchoring transpeptidase ErfK/SrfK
MLWIEKNSYMENSNTDSDSRLPSGNDPSVGSEQFSNNTVDWLDNIRNNKPLMKGLKTVGIILSAIAAALLVFVFLIYLVPAIQEIPSGGNTRLTSNAELQKQQDYRKQVTMLTRDVQRLSKKYSSYTSGQSYIVINTTYNRFYLYQNKKLVREGRCSSGSYTMLQTRGTRKWIFKTPKGKYWIQGKITNPVWKRPDWSFVEEGLPIPSPNDPSRWEYGVLGDYAMSIGDGYLIHGTIYKRFLGMPVTHGCVRLNDEDLEAIYKTLSVGSKVYIF